jgi:protein TonB
MMTMSMSAPVVPPGMPMLPHDLSRGQRTCLVALAVLAHVLVAWVVLAWPTPVVRNVEAPALEVALIHEAPKPQQVEPTPPAPVQPKVAPVRPPVLASTKVAQPKEMQAPPPAPVAETKPEAPVAQVAQPVATPASAVAKVPDTVQPPAQPLSLPSSALRYLVEPKADFPPVSRELGEGGLVKLRVLIDEQGRPVSVTLAESSGYPRLDHEAMRAMRSARFQPRIVDGVPRSVSTIAPINFDLQEQ